MVKASFNCSACGEENPPNSTFCVACGASVDEQKQEKGIASLHTRQSAEDLEQKRLKQKQSIPYLVMVCLFLIFIDLIDGGLEWALYPVIPIVLFAIIAPYWSLRIEK